MKSMVQFVAVMEKLIQMIAMLKMQVSQTGLKVCVTKLQIYNIKPLIRGVFCLWEDG